MPVGDQKRRTDAGCAGERVVAGDGEDRLARAADRRRVRAVGSRLPPGRGLRRFRRRGEGQGDRVPPPAALQGDVERRGKVADHGEGGDRIARRADPARADFEDGVAGCDARLCRRRAGAHRADHRRRDRRPPLASRGRQPPAGGGVADRAVGDQRIHDPEQQIARGCEVDADIGVAAGREDRRHHPHQAAFGVDQRAARHPRIGGRIGLDEILHGVEPRVGHVERRHDAAGHGQAQPVCVADGADGLCEPRRRRDGDRRARGVDAEDGDVARRVLRDQPRRQDAAVGKPDVDPPGRLDHVPGGRDVSRPQHHAAAFRRHAPMSAGAALGPPRPDRKDRDDRFQRVGGKRPGRSRQGADPGQQQPRCQAKCSTAHTEHSHALVKP